ncbi:MAG: hypothetical protein ACO1N6_06655 [Microcella sp.]
MPEKATPAQVELALRLAVKVQPPRSRAEHELWRQEVLEFDQVRIKAMIDGLNKRIGFSPSSSPASDRQLVFIGDLERKLYGRSGTKRSDGLTYADADARIKVLRRELADRPRKER